MPLAIVLLIVVVAGAGCRGSADPRGTDAKEPPAVAQTASEGAVATPSGALLTVAGVRRTARDVVQVDLVAVNGGATPLDLAADLEPSGGLAGAFLLSEDGLARVFVLADAGGAPQCSAVRGPLAPGARQPLYLRFGAQSGEAHRVTLRLPGLGVFEPLEIPAADAP